jgi:pimeloyl-ACP methyl ester carboxylesterase
MTVILSVLKIALVVYVGLCLLVSCRQASFVYFPTSHLHWTPRDVGLDHEELSLSIGGDETMHAWFIPVAEAELTVLFFHGNAGNIGDRVESIRLFAELGFNVMIVDYPGYGKSTGRPTEAGTYEAASAAWAYLVCERGLAPESISIFGRSLGGAVGAWLAEQKAARCLVLESAFTSISDMGKEFYPFLPVRLLTRIKYDTLGRIGQVGCPVLILHSPQDDVISYRHGKRLFEAAKDPKRFHELAGGHNTTVFDDAYRNVLRDFMMNGE